MPDYTDPLVTLYLGDCLDVMAALPADSVDAVCTDPPYGLKFMGKVWDHGVPAEPFWAEMLRVAKPGAYLLAFGGTRTVHRIATNIEDAGWIIRDMLMWIYASGFPKGKANLKPAHEPIVLARKPGPLRPLGIDAGRIPGQPQTTHKGGNRQGTSPAPMNWGEQTGHETPGAAARWPSNVLLSDPELFDEPNPWVVGSGATTTSGSRTGEHDGSGAWSGPFGKVNRDIEGDVGGYSRFFIIPKADRAERERGLAGAIVAKPAAESAFSTVCAKCKRQKVNVPGAACQCAEPEWERVQQTARANSHPTVKPIDLMRHLVRLVTPPGGVILDPFLGSGTTCLAASEEGFKSIGIEREAEYLEIAKGRLMATPMGLGLDVPATTRKPPKTHPDLSKHQPKRRAPAENWTGAWAGTEDDAA